MEPNESQNASQVEGQKAALRQVGAAGASWFYWIAGLSLVNTVIAFAGGSVRFVFGLGVTDLVSSLAAYAKQEQSAVAEPLSGIAILFSVIAAGILALFGWLAQRRMLWAYAIGMALYFGDSILCLLFQDWLAVVVHLIALFLLFRGFLAYSQLARLER
jgi:hypothetical protein